MEATGAGGSLDVVVFPWLAFGHMIPFLELSKRLAARSHAVAVVSTPRNLARLPPVPADLSARVRFVPLPLPTVDGLPEGAESTADVPQEKVELLKMAFDGLASPFAAFLADTSAGGRKPDWIINDFCHHWLPPIADDHKVPCALFEIVQASTVAFLGSRRADAEHPRTALEDFTVPPKWFRRHLPTQRVRRVRHGPPLADQRALSRRHLPQLRRGRAPDVRPPRRHLPEALHRRRDPAVSSRPRR